MKRIILSLFTLHFSLFTCLLASPFDPVPATEVVAYSPASSSQLHVSTVSTNPLDSVISRAFPSSYTGHRAVCTLSGAKTNDIFCAWIGGDAYTPGEPYGIALENANVIGLTRESPITPRINLVTASSDRAKTFDQIREEIRDRETDPAERRWIDNNRITPAAIAGDSFKSQRIRVVRWLINDVPVYRAGVDARIVLNKTIKTGVRDILTEADFLVGNEAFDLDWNDLYTEVVNNWDTIAALEGEEVRRISYLIVVGDGLAAWSDATSTNEVVALPTVITRHFGERQVKPSLMSAEPNGGKVKVGWRMDCPFEEGYTAFRIVVTSGGLSVFDSQKFYAMPINGQNLYSHTLNHTFDAGTYDWKIAAFNSKYSQDTANYYTNGVPFTVAGE